MGHKANVELVLDCADPKRLAHFWREALGYRAYYADAKLAVLVPREGIASPLLLQGVPEPRRGLRPVGQHRPAAIVGANQVGLQVTGGRGVDVVYDGVGKATFEGSLNSLRPRGMLVPISSTSAWAIRICRRRPMSSKS